MYARKRIKQNECWVRIENFVPGDPVWHHLAKSHDAKQWPLWWNFLSTPHTPLTVLSTDPISYHTCKSGCRPSQLTAVSVGLTVINNTVMILSFRTDMPGQTVQTRIRLLLEIRVYTVCHSVCIVWTHCSIVEPHDSNFRVIRTNFLGVRIFRIFTVLPFSISIIAGLKSVILGWHSLGLVDSIGMGNGIKPVFKPHLC